MVSNNYCQECEKYVNRRSKTKHINSKSLLYICYNIVTNKYYIGDVYWCDFEETICEYNVNNSSKFDLFSITVKCKLNNEDISN